MPPWGNRFRGVGPYEDLDIDPNNQRHTIEPQIASTPEDLHNLAETDPELARELGRRTIPDAEITDAT